MEVYRDLLDYSLVKKFRLKDQKPREVIVDFPNRKFPISLDGMNMADSSFRVVDFPNCKMRFIER